MRLPIQFYSLRRNLTRAILGPGTLESTAFDREVICPAENVEVPPAVYLPGQLERVTGAPPESTKELEIDQAIRRKVTHAATIGYHIRDAVIIDGRIYAKRLKYPLRVTPSVASKRIPPVELKKGALASSLLGNKYFGHWLRDDCLTYMLSEERSVPLCIEPSFAGPHLKNYQEYFDQEWSFTQRAYIDHLIVFQDYGQNSSKLRRYRRLNEKILQRFSGRRKTPFTYLRRGNTGASRSIENEFELIEMLSRRGFVVADLEKDRLEEILEILVNSQVIVSMEGSHLAHCVFSVPSRSGLLVLQPPDRFASIHRGWAICQGIEFGFVVGSRGSSGYIFSGQEIERTLGLMTQRL
jgi:Glycosyltransferase 61